MVYRNRADLDSDRTPAAAACARDRRTGAWHGRAGLTKTHSFNPGVVLTLTPTRPGLGFSNRAPSLTLCWRFFVEGYVLGLTRCSAASPASSHQMLIAALTASRDNRSCPQGTGRVGAEHSQCRRLGSGLLGVSERTWES